VRLCIIQNSALKIIGLMEEIELGTKEEKQI
jgi:hypothetical protein